MNNDYCVYLHRSVADGVVFYLGKGRDNRAYLVKNRTKVWQERSAGGFVVELLYTDLSYEEAEDKEAELLASPDKDWKLVNKYKGRIPHQLLQITDVYYAEDSPTFLRWKTTLPNSRRRAGEVAGCVVSNKYASVMVNRISYLAHRLIWVLHTGQEIPRGYVINHIDCNPSNNHISNLECITFAQNNRRKKAHQRENNGVFEIATRPNKTKSYYNAAGTVTIDGKVFNKYFSYLKYGKEEAFRLALQWRQQKIKELNEQGAGYSDRHGT